MAIAKVGSTVGHEIAADTNPDVIGLPAGLAQNDIILITRGSDGLAWNAMGAINTSGYSEVGGGESSAHIRVDRKFMGATPDSSVSINGGGTGSEDGTAVLIEAYRDVNLTTPIDAAAQIGTSFDRPDPPSYTTVTADTLRYIAGFHDDDLYTPSAPTGGWGNLQSQQVGATNAGGTLMLATLAAPTAGTLDPGIFGGAVTDQCVAIHFALRLASGGVSIPIFARHYRQMAGKRII